MRSPVRSPVRSPLARSPLARSFESGAGLLNAYRARVAKGPAVGDNFARRIRYQLERGVEECARENGGSGEIDRLFDIPVEEEEGNTAFDAFAKALSESADKEPDVRFSHFRPLKRAEARGSELDSSVLSFFDSIQREAIDVAPRPDEWEGVDVVEKEADVEELEEVEEVEGHVHEVDENGEGDKGKSEEILVFGEPDMEDGYVRDLETWFKRLATATADGQ